MNGLIMVRLAKMNEISDELKEWLSTRKRLLKVRDAFRNDGGHIMLKREFIDPKELAEPLRTEALEYLQRLK